MKKMEIDKKNKEVKLLINTKFYDSGSVLKASQSFTRSCWIYINELDGKLLVSLKPKFKEINLDELGYEFYNYVLGIMQNEYL